VAKDSKIQGFNSAKVGIGLKKISVAFWASVPLWQKIQRFKGPVLDPESGLFESGLKEWFCIFNRLLIIPQGVSFAK
jgi:hypothetical protein